MGGGWRQVEDFRDRQAEDGPHVQFELGHVLGDHGHHAGIVGAWRDLAEVNGLPLDEQLHAEDAATAQGVGNRQSLAFGLIQHLLGHGHRLP